MDDDDLHISRIQTAWSMVRDAHGDHTAVQSAQQRLLDRYGGAIRRYALSALRDEDAAKDEDELFRTSWRDELLARCWQRLADDEKESGKPYHTVLRYRVAHPELRSPELADGLSKELGKPINAGAVRVLLHRARD